MASKLLNFIGIVVMVLTMTGAVIGILNLMVVISVISVLLLMTCPIWLLIWWVLEKMLYKKPHMGTPEDMVEFLEDGEIPTFKGRNRISQYYDV